MSNISAALPRWKPLLVFLGLNVVAATVASAAAFTSFHLGFAPWAMFVGWVAYFTRPLSARQGFFTWICLTGGLALGAVAVLALHSLTPLMGSIALALVVFIVASAVVSMRAVRIFDNVLAWFLGLIPFFAAHLEPSLVVIAELAAAGALGSTAGWASQHIQARVGTAH